MGPSCAPDVGLQGTPSLWSYCGDMAPHAGGRAQVWTDVHIPVGLMGNRPGHLVFALSPPPAPTPSAHFWVSLDNLRTLLGDAVTQPASDKAGT